MKKRLLTTLVMVLFIILFFPVYVRAEEGDVIVNSGTAGNVTWTLSSEGVLEITYQWAFPSGSSFQELTGMSDEEVAVGRYPRRNRHRYDASCLERCG